MSHKGFSHLGPSTLDLDKIREFYEGVLGFKPVISDAIKIKKAGASGISSSILGATSS